MRLPPLKARIDASARRLFDFLEWNDTERYFDYPFSSSYPRNACMSVSLILTYLLEAKYALDSVEIIKGTKPGTNDQHFWVKVGEWRYDLTAHQFGRNKPIIGALTHPLFLRFSEWEIETGRELVDRDTIIAFYRAGDIPF